MQKYNFLHLTGLIYEGRKPLSFYEDLEKNKVNPDLIYHPKNGFSKLKIATSDDIQFLKSDKVSICDEKSFVHLKFDKSIQNKKVSLSLKKSANHFIPLSLLNLADEKKSKALAPTYPVLKIEEYDFKTKENSIVFNKLSSNYSDEVDKLLDSINLTTEKKNSVLENNMDFID